jgi:hypothetical protein
VTASTSRPPRASIAYRSPRRDRAPCPGLPSRAKGRQLRLLLLGGGRYGYGHGVRVLTGCQVRIR